MCREFLLGYSLIILLLSSGLTINLTSRQIPDPDFQSGMSYVWYWRDTYLSADSDSSLVKLAETNTRWVGLITTWYQDNKSSTTIYPDPQKTPLDSSIVHAIQKIHSLEMKVMLKPHVDCVDNTFRQYIEPSDWDEWFESYRNFINHYAVIAQENGVEQFCIGVELEKTESHDHNWRSVISEVRSQFGGPIIYAANWSNYNNVSWWDDLDYVGINAYFPLTNKSDPTVEELKSTWKGWVEEIESWRTDVDKQVIFTEIGYVSLNGTNEKPWEGSVSQHGHWSGEIDLQEQADCYEAAFQTLWNKTWLEGLYWWAWIPWIDAGGSSDGSYTPQNKPAQTIITSWYAEISGPYKPGVPRTLLILTIIIIVGIIIFPLKKIIDSRSKKNKG